MKAASNYKHIIWDWNGTLLDDSWLFVDVMNEILRNRKMTTITLEKYRDIFGFPVKDYYLKLGFDLEKEPFKETGLEFINAYEKRKYDADLHIGVKSLLKKLIEKGFSHSILSAQHQSTLDNLIEYYGIQKYFIQINGLNNHYAESKIEVGIKWMADINLNPKNVLMIGDTDHDLEVAIAIDADCLLLSHGHFSKTRLLHTGCDVINNLSEIFQLFKIDSNSIFTE